MSPSKKVLPLRKTNARALKVEIKTIRLRADDLRANLQDAQAVVNIAIEAWLEENEHSAASCIGVLDLINYKLERIERAAQDIMGCVKARNASA